MSDIRIYTYSGSGTLLKPTGKLGKKYSSVEECRDAITMYEHVRKLRARQYNLKREDNQYVIVEYTAPYKSKILETV